VGRGFSVTAFDISTSAINWCRHRFPNSRVSYEVHDAFAPRREWQHAFDLVVEAYTLQVLPPAARPRVMQQIARWVAPGGILLVISRGRGADESEGQMPWPLTRDEVSRFAAVGLVLERFEDYLDHEEPPVRRFRVCFRCAANKGVEE
jgi:SAM-dependent methyltransferase